MFVNNENYNSFGRQTNDNKLFKPFTISFQFKFSAAGKNLFIEGKVTLGMEYKSPSRCSTSKCHTEAMKRELEKRAEKVKNFVSEYKSGSGKYGRISNVVYDFIYYCESGYEQNNFMCTPCYPGFYSPPNDPACHRCPKDTYQDNFGSSRCLKCPDGGKTKKPGATSVVTCRGPLKVQVGPRKVKLDRLMLYVGASVGVLGLIFMIATCIYLVMKIKQNPDVSKKEVVKGEMKKAKKKAGESAQKAKRKVKSVKKKKSKKSKTESEGESDVAEDEDEEKDEDEENENNSNLANVPLLKSSKPKYDKNSRNLRKIKEEGTKQTRIISSKDNVNKNNKSSVEERGTKQTRRISSRDNVNKNNKFSVEEEGTKQTRIISSRGNVNKNNKSSVPVFTSSDADFVPRNTGRPVGLKGSVSESTASNIRAARNAALLAKSNVNNCNTKLSREKAVLADSKPARRSHSRSTASSRISSRVANTRAILTEGKAKYGNDAYCRLIAKVSQDNRRANSTPTPTSLVNSPASTSIYSTPPDKLYPVQHADSWYSTEWDPSEGSTTTCVTVEQTKSSNSRLSSQVEDTDSLGTGDSWHDSYHTVP